MIVVVDSLFVKRKALLMISHPILQLSLPYMIMILIKVLQMISLILSCRYQLENMYSLLVILMW